MKVKKTLKTWLAQNYPVILEQWIQLKTAEKIRYKREWFQKTYTKKPTQE